MDNKNTDSSIDNTKTEEEQNTLMSTIAINMLKQNSNIQFISTVTGLTYDDILKLKHKL